ncbi:hypothetical protein GCM10010191_49110 [Actinomadura vinacea]|uniref:DUF2946 domain-containing protein n=1 Tax=Actinomadura vinacea TaxID=115336 RepID=A0ABN3JJM2_9ACTN
MRHRAARTAIGSRLPAMRAPVPVVGSSLGPGRHDGGGPISPWRVGNPKTLLLGFALICCVIAMHGLQASNSPANAQALPKVSSDHMLMGTLVGTEESGHGTSQGNGSHDPGEHAGGEICLALLTLALWIVLLRAVWRAWRYGFLIRRGRARGRVRRSGRSPPPLAFRSAVLRL